MPLHRAIAANKIPHQPVQGFGRKLLIRNDHLQRVYPAKENTQAICRNGPMACRLQDCLQGGAIADASNICDFDPKSFAHFWAR